MPQEVQITFRMNNDMQEEVVAAFVRGHLRHFPGFSDESLVVDVHTARCHRCNGDVDIDGLCDVCEPDAETRAERAQEQEFMEQGGF